MAKSISRRTGSSVRNKPVRVKRKTGKQARNKTFGGLARIAMLIALELSGLLLVAALAIAVAMGYASAWFSGTGLLTHLLPFIFGVLVLAALLAFFIVFWWKFRRPLQALTAFLPPAVSTAAGLFALWAVSYGDLAPAFDQFKVLVGGREQVSRITLAHQVYASYRRYGSAPLQRMVERGRDYRTAVDEAADSFGIDPDLLLGVAAAESSFMPRDSRDGGRGLFQLTRVPEAAMEEAALRLAVDRPSVQIARHHAFIAAATLQYYLRQMDNDLFLGLLAYNIGPRNGGLRFIMDRYGVTDFVTIQPYLKKLPRDYPIRVLSYALAFRIWRQQGRVLPYEKADNAQTIQRIGIPGLNGDFF